MTVDTSSLDTPAQVSTTHAPSDILAQWLVRYPNLSTTQKAALQQMLEAQTAPLAAAHVAVVGLAWAAGLGEPTALADFDREFIAVAQKQLAARGLPHAQLEEAAQLSRIRLFVNKDTNAQPAIFQYYGRGPLLAFVRTTMMRQALRLLPTPRECTVSQTLVAAPTHDHELALLFHQHGQHVQAAIDAAWRQLAKHDRFVLSLVMHAQFATAQIATLYGIHPASAARRLASARTALLAATKLRLRETLQASDATVESVLRSLAPALSVGDLAPATGITSVR